MFSGDSSGIVIVWVYSGDAWQQMSSFSSLDERVGLPSPTFYLFLPSSPFLA